MSFKEGYIEYPDGLKVRYRLNEHNKGMVAVFLHSIGDRLEVYEYLFPYFETAGIALNALELRGHGMSGNAASDGRGLDGTVTDLKRFLYGYLQNRPVYIIAAGAGALPVIKTIRDPRLNVKGVVFISPLLFIKMEKGRRFALQVLSRLAPGMHVPNPAKGEFLRCIADPDLSGALESCALKAVEGFRAGFIGGLFAEMKKAQKDLYVLGNFPVMLLAGEADPVNDTDRTEKCFKDAWAQSKNLKIISCRKCGHYLLLEKDRLDFVEKIIRWIVKLETGN